MICLQENVIMSYPQIIDMFDDVLTKKDKEFLESIMIILLELELNSYINILNILMVVKSLVKKKENSLRKNPVNISEQNNNLFEVWHVVWRGEAKQGVLTYVNEVGFQTTRL